MTYEYGPTSKIHQSPICPYCEGEIKEFESEYNRAQAEIIVVVMCPHCRKVLGMVGHDCED